MFLRLNGFSLLVETVIMCGVSSIRDFSRLQVFFQPWAISLFLKTDPFFIIVLPSCPLLLKIGPVHHLPSTFPSLSPSLQLPDHIFPSPSPFSVSLLLLFFPLHFLPLSFPSSLFLSSKFFCLPHPTFCFFSFSRPPPLSSACPLFSRLPF